MKKFLHSFKYAFQGVSYSFRTQLNFKVHTFAAIFAISLGFIVKISHQEWLWIILAIGLVLISELINTALETLVDLVSPKYNPKAGIVKDVAAAAVLITACLAIAIGIIIFVPKLF